MKNVLLISVLLVIGVNSQIYAQLPITDIYDIKYTETDDYWEIEEIDYLNTFNENGYNNQPYGVSDDVVLISSNKYGGNTEIIKLEFESYTYSRMTNNREGEYSPQVHLGTGGLSVVAVDSHKRQQIRLYGKYEKEFDILFPELDQVAYYSWVGVNNIAISVLTGVKEEMNLVVGNVSKNQYATIIENVGRCIVPTRDRKGFYFTHQLSENSNFIKYYDLQDNKISIVSELLTGVSDFEVLDNGDFIIGKGAIVYRLSKSDDNQWVKLIDLSTYGIHNINRLSKVGTHLLLCNGLSQ